MSKEGIEESFDTIFNIGCGSRKSAMDERVKKYCIFLTEKNIRKNCLKNSLYIHYFDFIIIMISSNSFLSLIKILGSRYP